MENSRVNFGCVVAALPPHVYSCPHPEYIIKEERGVSERGVKCFLSVLCYHLSFMLVPPVETWLPRRSLSCSLDLVLLRFLTDGYLSLKSKFLTCAGFLMSCLASAAQNVK